MSEHEMIEAEQKKAKREVLLAGLSAEHEFRKGYDQAVDEIITHFEKLPAQRQLMEPREVVDILRAIWKKDASRG